MIANWSLTLMLLWVTLSFCTFSQVHAFAMENCSPAKILGYIAPTQREQEIRNHLAVTKVLEPNLSYSVFVRENQGQKQWIVMSPKSTDPKTRSAEENFINFFSAKGNLTTPNSRKGVVERITKPIKAAISYPIVFLMRKIANPLKKMKASLQKNPLPEKKVQAIGTDLENFKLIAKENALNAKEAKTLQETIFTVSVGEKTYELNGLQILETLKRAQTKQTPKSQTTAQLYPNNHPLSVSEELISLYKNRGLLVCLTAACLHFLNVDVPPEVLRYSLLGLSVHSAIGPEISGKTKNQTIAKILNPLIIEEGALDNARLRNMRKFFDENPRIEDAVLIYTPKEQARILKMLSEMGFRVFNSNIKQFQF